MPLSNITPGPRDNLLLYKASQTINVRTTASKVIQPTSNSSENSVQISEEAKAVFKSQKISNTENADNSIKSRLNKLFQDARDEGSFITFDSSKGGEWLDVSSFTDDELAQITNNKEGSFSKDLSIYAQAMLAQREKLSLEPFEAAIGYGDFRGEAAAIRTLYNHMSQNVRDALGWTESMVEVGEEMASHSGKALNKSHLKTLWDILLEVAQQGGLSLQNSPNQDNLQKSDDKAI
ncbi:hypothetical protein [Zymomonas mobilis]|uniref:hypothetical protein n=1 Tax=Zymomonas mobilis TaxID=542 RepID=UPI0003C753F8|nr:hypothetical protein [Zymomonas mobilis]AHB10439.1 hypothetical protein ZCP4_1144 [Zymomonas mobilis subsp. mobilis str. CP4 = NRRL B-14023]AHJ70745.1 hypothetical protein A254_01134 [Zymomonas mobilis subsp. mobilis NRRL B-12526]AHJ72599.1 hypothetical protein A265_01135 [Zymomonas mobilis subsp. mobilis str. CP4 = NRRL B-14023]TWE26571.1 hypothetical protein FBY52_10127 [Zymomonas mobilis]